MERKNQEAINRKKSWYKSLSFLALVVALIGGIPGLIQTYSFFTDKPKINGEVVFVVTGTKQPPEMINNKEYPTGVLVYVVLTNQSERAITLANYYKLDIRLHNGTVEAKPFMIRDTDNMLFEKQAELGGLDFRRDYLLLKDKLGPIKYGDIIKGWVSFVVDRQWDEIVKDGVEYQLYVKDVFGNWHKIKKHVMSSSADKKPKYFSIAQMGVNGA